MRRGPERDVNYSSPTSAKVKNEWRYISTPLMCHHGVERENFTFNRHYSNL